MQPKDEKINPFNPLVDVKPNTVVVTEPLLPPQANTQQVGRRLSTNFDGMGPVVTAADNTKKTSSFIEVSSIDGPSVRIGIGNNDTPFGPVITKAGIERANQILNDLGANVAIVPNDGGKGVITAVDGGGTQVTDGSAELFVDYVGIINRADIKSFDQLPTGPLTPPTSLYGSVKHDESASPYRAPSDPLFDIPSVDKLVEASELIKEYEAKPIRKIDPVITFTSISEPGIGALNPYLGTPPDQRTKMTSEHIKAAVAASAASAEKDYFNAWPSSSYDHKAPIKVTITGPNGYGKTVLGLRLMKMLSEVGHGNVSFNDNETPLDIRNKIVSELDTMPLSQRVLDHPIEIFEDHQQTEARLKRRLAEALSYVQRFNEVLQRTTGGDLFAATGGAFITHTCREFGIGLQSGVTVAADRQKQAIKEKIAKLHIINAPGAAEMFEEICKDIDNL